MALHDIGKLDDAKPAGPRTPLPPLCAKCRKRVAFVEVEVEGVTVKVCDGCNVELWHANERVRKRTARNGATQHGR